MGSWTPQQILELAPDASSSKAGQGLAKPTKWQTLGRSDRALWGEIKGSGSKPYQVRIDLTEPAFKCSCPSRKFPCKHALALFLILAESPGAVAETKPPAWVGDWLKERDARNEQRAARRETAAEVDPVAQARRADKREANVRRGVEELMIWLKDLARQGLGSAQAQPAAFWEGMAARMVDAQAPGLARYVRHLGAISSSGEGWQERMSTITGRLHLLLTAYQNIEALSDDLQADVRTYVGWTTPEEELRKLPCVDDRWIIVGQVTSRQERLRVRRTWLLGRKSQRFALVLQFAAGSQSFDTTFALGTEFEAQLTFYPGARPLRAAVLQRTEGGLIREPLPPGVSIHAARQAFVEAIAVQPWLESSPVFLNQVTPCPGDVRDLPNWLLADETANSVSLMIDTDCGWQLLAISGGGPIQVFGEWDGRSLQPLSVFRDGRSFAQIQSESGALLARVA
ncbi:MAG: SWIM zinc finger family protein [Phycisphaerae bacterium]|nr:SWIM zinc finger family protein [Phycisphaerae bacterium]